MTQKIHTSSPHFTKKSVKKTLLTTLVITSVSIGSIVTISPAYAEGEEDLSKYRNTLANNVSLSNPNATAEQKSKRQAEQKSKRQAEQKDKSVNNQTTTQPATGTISPNSDIDTDTSETTSSETTTIVPRMVLEAPQPTFSELTQAPNESALSFANRELLTHNAQLERDVNDLKTQVNVLVNERSGQLFMYGVYTAIASFLAGGLLCYLIFGHRKNNW